VVEQTVHIAEHERFLFEEDDPVESAPEQVRQEVRRRRVCEGLLRVAKANAVQ